MQATQLRSCSKCERTIPLEQFNRTKNRSRDGYRPWCKSCERIYNASYRTAHRARLAEQKRVEKVKNRERYRASDARRYAAIRAERLEKVRTYKRANAGKVNAASARRYAKRLKAVPSWFDREATLAIYVAAEKLRRAFPGLDLEVDHIVPICSALVCGLHVHANLRVILATENGAKSNRYWPDMP